jgi:hypothetical protein
LNLQGWTTMRSPKTKPRRVRIVVTIYLANVANFFHTRRRSTDLNQAEDLFPAEFFVSFRTRHLKIHIAGMKGKES